MDVSEQFGQLAEPVVRASTTGIHNAVQHGDLGIFTVV
jgi:hypothetical protein